MAINPAVPDYELADTIVLTDSTPVQAIGNQLRTTILGLLHERAATVTEIARAVGRPKSTVAYHVEVLHEAGLVRVVRTRRVRAIEERYYGRTARMFYVGVGKGPGESGAAVGLQRLRHCRPGVTERPIRPTSCGRSSDTPGSLPSGQPSFGQRSWRWCTISTDYPVLGTPPTGSWSASTRFRITRCSPSRNDPDSAGTVWPEPPVKRDVLGKRLLVIGLIVSVLVVTHAGGASACSCSQITPSVALEEADLAFVGTLVDRPGIGDAIYRGCALHLQRGDLGEGGPRPGGQWYSLPIKARLAGSRLPSASVSVFS